MVLFHVFPFFPSQCFSFSLPALALEQSPDTVIRQGQSTNLSCSKKKSSSTAMHWYRLPLGKDSRLVLVASALEAGKATIEEDLRSHFKSSEIQGDKITLLIEHAFLNDSVYLSCFLSLPPH
uniref:Ig-like domain-containing protein n=1 Tax=Bubo bubo TaxID=30461 RepID=A0A8C0EPQ2_BUBBB